MSANRKLQGEIQQVLKKVEEGVQLFDEIWEKVYAAEQQSLKEKYEADLKKEIKKLQRLRDQIKTWLGGNEIKDKTQLTEVRKTIETKMEQFKVCEKDTKTKAYSKEGLARDSKLDPKEALREEKRTWLNESLDKLNDLVDSVEAEREKLLGSSKGKSKNKDALERFDNRVQKHKWHMAKLELIIKLLDNEDLEPALISGIQDSLDYYIESAVDDDGALGVEHEFDIYEELELDSHVGTSAPKFELRASGKEDEGASPVPSSAPSHATADGADAAESESAVPSAAAAAAVAPVPTTVGGKKGAATAKVGAKAEPTAATKAVAAPVAKASPKVPAPAPAPTTKAAAGKASAKPVPVDDESKNDPVESAASRPAAPAATASGMSWAAHAASAVPAAPASAASASQPATSPVPATLPAAAKTSPPPPAVTAPPALTQAPAQVPSQAPEPVVAPTHAPHVKEPVSAAVAAHASPAPSQQPSQPIISTAPPLPPLQQAPKLNPELQNVLAQLRQSMAFSPEAIELDKQSSLLQYQPRNVYANMHPTFPSTPQFTTQTELAELFERLPMDTLFFVFYFQQGTYQQYLAARQLKKHSWRFHKKYMTWFQRHEEPKVATEDFEEGTYVYFDYESGWCQRIKSEFKFEYAYLEDELGGVDA